MPHDVVKTAVFPEKSSKKRKNFQKKVLTIKRDSDIIIKRAAEGRKKPGRSEQRTLKTIQRKRKERQLILE